MITKTTPKAKPETVTQDTAEVTFQATASSSGLRSFGFPKEDDRRGSDVKPSSSSGILSAGSSVTSQRDEEEVQALVTRTKEEYIEPWDYGTYYPTVLPLREPNSGDPEICDQEEFGELAKRTEYDERTINSANKLGLTSQQQQGEKQMILFKLPGSLPVMKQSTGSKGKPSEGLPESFMGKMLVYKSGAVKLKFGDVPFDVSPGPEWKFHTDVAAVDTKGKKCTRIGSSTKFATVTPDVETLLNSTAGMEIHK